MASRAIAALFALGVVVACSDVSTDLTGAARDARDANVPRDGRMEDAPSVGGELDAGGPQAQGPRAMCGDKLCQCDDGKENDKDGLIDGLDPECTAPFDDREETFATGRPRGGPNACQDCFWDGNTESDDDGCSRAPACLLEGTAMPMPRPMGPPLSCDGCDADATCVDGCRKYTPNGCDCFGCCDVTQADGSTAQLVLGEECSLAVIADAKKCPPCIKSAQCENPCGRCELCLGKPMSELPADCEQAEEAPQHACDDGSATCSESTPCAVDYYCVLGCCMPALL
jgi:hypothetical protein